MHHFCPIILTLTEEGDDLVGKRNNFTRYNKLYNGLYHEVSDELRDTKEQLKNVQKQYEEALSKIDLLERKIKVQQKIIEELESRT